MTMPHKRCKTTAAVIESDEKARQALALRRAGSDFDTIAKQVGYSNRSGAWKAVSRLLKQRSDESAKDAEAVLSLELDRLDFMLRALWPKVMAGDPLAIDRAIKIQDRRAKYLGLDAPARQELTGKDGAQLFGPVIFIPPEDGGENGAAPAAP